MGGLVLSSDGKNCVGMNTSSLWIFRTVHSDGSRISQTGVPILKGGQKPIILAIFPKTTRNFKKWDLAGACNPAPPPVGSANGTTSYLSHLSSSKTALVISGGASSRQKLIQWTIIRMSIFLGCSKEVTVQWIFLQFHEIVTIYLQ